MRFLWTCQENVGNLGTPKLVWGKVLPQKLAFDGQGSKGSDCNCERKILSVNEDIDLFLLVGESVVTPLWGKCEVATHTPENGTWKSSGTPKNSERDYRAQNTLHWGVLYIVGKVLKCRCPKWPCMSHLDICSTSYGRKKGRESKWQFGSRPLKVGNRPNSGVCRWCVTNHWKDLKES
jgi:hypothetical protein